MSPIERVESVLAGRLPDGPPVSFWSHFRPDQVEGPSALAAHIDLVETYDLDFLKVMNDNPYPHPAPLQSVHDLSAIDVLRGDEPGFSQQLDLISDLRRTLNNRVYLTTTVFNTWATLRRLINPPKRHNPPRMDGRNDGPSMTIMRYVKQDEKIVRRAVSNMAVSLANFARRCLDAGADGVFLSVRDDWVTHAGGPTAYDELVRPGDLRILAAAAGGRFNLLHVCGRPVNFRAFAEYPVHAINWADRAAGPSIAEVRDWLRPAICGGVDNLSTLPDGSPQDCEAEVIDARRQAGTRPIMIAPGCTYDPERVPRANLEAICRAARGPH
jgi:uroporphyrinogen decarboxylase